MRFPSLTKWMLGVVVAFGFHASASATVINGTLDATPNGGSTVDYVHFSVTQTTLVSFNILAWENLLDLNGDGKLTSFDSTLSLFRGSLNMANLIGFNDDSPNFVFGAADGSSSMLDSFMAMMLSPGDYILAIGHFGSMDVLDGIQNGFGNAFGHGKNYGAYRLNISNANISNLRLVATAVPEPASLALLGVGLLGVAGLRRRAR